MKVKLLKKVRKIFPIEYSRATKKYRIKGHGASYWEYDSYKPARTCNNLNILKYVHEYHNKWRVL